MKIAECETASDAQNSHMLKSASQSERHFFYLAVVSLT